MLTIKDIETPYGKKHIRCLSFEEIEERLELNKDVVEALNFEVGQKVGDLNEILDYSYQFEKTAVRSRSVELLSRRDYSHHEMSQKLYELGFHRPAIEDALDWLEEMSLIDDERLLERLATSYLNQGRGKFDIQRRLAAKGFDSQSISTILNSSNPEIDEDAALNRALRVISRIDLESYKGRSQAYRRLMSRGYSTEQIEHFIEVAISQQRDA